MVSMNCWLLWSLIKWDKHPTSYKSILFHITVDHLTFSGRFTMTKHEDNGVLEIKLEAGEDIAIDTHGKIKEAKQEGLSVAAKIFTMFYTREIINRIVKCKLASL